MSSQPKKTKRELTSEEKAEREARRVAKFRKSMAESKAERNAQFASVHRWAAADKPQPGLTDADRERLEIEIRLNEQDEALIEQTLKSRRSLNFKLFELRHPEGSFLPKQGFINVLEQDILAMEAVSMGCAKDIGDGMIEIDLALLATRKAEAQEAERAESAARLKESVESIKTTPPLPTRKKGKPATPDKPADLEGGEGRVQ